jgi:predicted acyl esterase
LAPVGDQNQVAAAAEVDPLVADGVAAVEALVGKDGGHCSLKDAVDADSENGVELGFVLCDDGLPPSGGGAQGIPVPAKYAASASGNDWLGLPAPASEEEVAEAEASDDVQSEDGRRITLDVDITLPPAAGISAEYGMADWKSVKAPKKGFPVIVFMHGCCGGNKTSWEAPTVDAAREQWHHSNAWFASRGYVVVNYTARGFRNGSDRGSTGTTQLDSRRYEINDYQYLVGLLADSDAQRRAAGLKPIFRINPTKIGAVGGSYGGGFSWLALTDPKWTSPAQGIPIKLAAVTTKYGWTDLVESLVPSGHYFDDEIAPTKVKAAPSRHPIGVQKQSIVAGLYGSGNAAATNHTTFPSYLHDTYARLQVGEPYDGDPQIEATVDTFLTDRSAYYQGSFWRKVRNGLKVPVYSAATWTDPLFPTMEHVRFYNKLTKVNPRYPITMYLGDYQHFVQNKAKEWDDLCGDDHHVCLVDDYRRDDGSLNLNKAEGRVRVGINTRINRFLDHYLKGTTKRPRSNVTATTTICPANATETLLADEPGVEYRAGSWAKLTAGRKVLGWEGGGMTSSVAVDGHGPDSDPVARDRQANKCYTTSQTNPGPGIVQYTSEAFAEDFTMMGLPTLELAYEASAADYWVAARLFDKAPGGQMTLVTRGVCKVNTNAEPDIDCKRFQLLGNGWLFAAGHQAVVEVTQSDVPFLRRSNTPSTLTISEANITLPVASPSLRKDFRD